MKNKRIAMYGLLIALAMIFSYLESMLPSIGIPGVKLGIANLVGMIALYCLKPVDAIVITFVRILFTGFTFGNLFAVLYSAAGAVLSLSVMILCKKKNWFDKVTVSVLGGVFHNIGQLLIAAFILQNAGVFSYLPVLIFAGTIAGVVVGMLSGMVVKRIDKVIQALTLIIVVSVFTTSGCSSKKTEKYDRMFFAFDTVISLSIYSEEDGEALLDKCVEMCTEIEETFSRTKQGSELYRINHRDTDTVEISDAIRDVLEVGFHYYNLSEGLFDFTVAPLSDLWDFKSEDAVVPPEEMIAAAVKKVDASLVQLKGNQLVFQSPYTMIDLGALVKGYAADQMKAFLKQKGVEHGLLNLGGNVLTIGTKPDGQLWSIGIQKPFGEQNSTADIVQVADKTVVSSGIYERYMEQDGVLYHHILNPRTGYSFDNEIAGVSVICDSSLEGDALSTTCLMLGVKKATTLIHSKKNTEAIFILKDGTVIKTQQQFTTP